MAYLYYATSQAPTAVTHSCVGVFTAPGDLNLILGKANRLEIYKVTSAGLAPVYDVSLYGRIGTMNMIRIAPEKKDYLIITTERHQMMVLSYDASARAIATVASGDLRDRVGRKTQRGQLALLEPSGRAVALQFYDGLLKIVPCEKGGFGRERAFNLRIDEVNVLDACFLHGTAAPTLALLYRDQADAVRVRTYIVSLADRALEDGPWSIPAPRGDPIVLVPVPSPIGGILLLGRTAITYHSNNSNGSGSSSSSNNGAGGSASMMSSSGAGSSSSRDTDETIYLSSPLSIRAHCMIDANRYLIADDGGGLYLLVLKTGAGGSSSSDTSSSGGGGGGGKAAVGLSGGSSSSSSSSSSTTNSVLGLEWSRVGDTVVASTLQYLDAGVVYVGSVGGDPQIIRLKQTRDATTGNFFDVLATHASLAPIVDFAVVDLDRQGQGAVVTCSGVGKDGSLRVVRNSVGIAEQAVVDLPGIRGLWSLRPSSTSDFDKYLVQSYSEETRIFAIEGDAMNEAELGGFRADVNSLYCGSMAHDMLVQVIATEARLVSGSEDRVVDSWKPPPGSRITVASGNAWQILVALSGGVVVLLELEASSEGGSGGSSGSMAGSAAATLVQKSTSQLPHEVACLSIHPVPTAAATTTVTTADAMVTESSSSSSLAATATTTTVSVDLATARASLAAVGLWTDITFRLLKLPTLEQVAEESLGGDIPPRSALLASLDGQAHAFVGTGDGHLFTFRLNTSPSASASYLTERKKVQLGRQPISLTPFRNRGALHVFAACDRPTIVFSMSRKLLYSNVNLGEVRVMAPFHSESFPDCLAIASPTTLTVGTVDEIQRLHVKTVPLGEQPRRIAHHRASRSLLVATEGMRPTSSSSSSSSAVGGVAIGGGYVESGMLRLVDDGTYEPLPGVTLELDPHELCMSMVSVSLGETTPNVNRTSSTGSAASENSVGASKSDVTVSASSSSSASSTLPAYIAVGTSYVLEDEEEPSRGRILILSVSGSETGRRLQLVTQREVRGGVFALAPLAGGKLVASINSKVQVYKWGIPAGNNSSASSKHGAAVTVDNGALTGAGGSGSADMNLSSSNDGSAFAVPFTLIPECGYHGHILGLQLDTRGDFILVGDLMKSLSLLRYNPVNSTLEEAAADPSTMWMTASAMLDDSTFVGGERHYNLFTTCRNVHAAAEEQRLRLDVTGEFHIGDLINRIRPGSLVMLPADAEISNIDGLEGSGSGSSSSMSLAEENNATGGAGGDEKGSSKRPRHSAGGASVGLGGGVASAAGGSMMMMKGSSSSSAGFGDGARPRLIVATVSGAVGALISLPPPLFKYLQRAQAAMNRVMHGVGALSHGSFRAFYRGDGVLPNLFPGAPEPASKGYIDGDMLEMFLDMNQEAQEKVVKLLNGDVSTSSRSAAVDATVKGASTTTTVGAGGGGGGGVGGATKVTPNLIPPGTVKHPDGRSDGNATLEELVRVIEDMSRLH